MSAVRSDLVDQTVQMTNKSSQMDRGENAARVSLLVVDEGAWWRAAG